MIQRGRTEKEIDVSEELAREPIEGERGAGDLGGKRAGVPGARLFLLTTVALVVLCGGFFTYESVKHSGQARIAEEQKEKDELAQSKLPAIQASRDAAAAPVPGVAIVPGASPTVPALTAAPITPAEPGMASAGASGVQTVNQTGGQRPPTRRELLLTRRLGGGFGNDVGGGSAAPGNGSGGAAQLLAREAGPADPDSLQGRLQAVKLAGSRAGRLGDRNFLITKGSMIDCGLGTRLDTTVPGMVSCYVTRDIWSASGQVVLIPRNSKVTGSYSKGIAQGQSRVFVSWDRVETPDGVIVDVDSPGTDALGGSGLPGKVNNHFWGRFGGAILMSVLSDALQAGIASASASGTTNINTTQQTTNDLANTALQNSINIPPTLYKNQGDRVNIFVARDMDFSGIYALKPR